MLANTAVAVVCWILVGPLVVVGGTVVAGRLLGARRGWVALLASGIIGFSGAVLVAGVVTGWEWDTAAMALLAAALGLLFTMVVALGLDLVAPLGSLAHGQSAGLVTVTNPAAALRSRAAIARRYREILRIARANGLVGRSIDHQQLPNGVRQTLEQAGGMFVKLGQVASTRTDVLPAGWCAELAVLRSNAAVTPETVMRPHVEAELGMSVSEAFAEFDWSPIASASIAQVYTARLADGRPVVVKVQRPGLDELVAVDSAAVLQLAGLIERRTPLGLAVRPRDLAAEFVANVAEELDFRIEAANAAALAEGLADDPNVMVPQVIGGLSGRRLLVEERVSGISVADVDGLRSQGIDPRQLAEQLLDLFLVQIFEVGVYHADPHPGNLLVDSNGRICLIDLGAVGRLGPGQRSIVTDLLLAASAADPGLIVDALGRMTSLDPGADLRELSQQVDVLLGRHMRSGGGIDTAALQDLAVLAGRFGLRLPSWFGTLARTMVTLEGTLRGIEPSFSLVDAARSAATRRTGGSRDLSSVRAAVEHEAMAQFPRLRRLPERVDALLGQASEGRLTARLAVFSDPHSESVVTKLVDRLTIAIVASALGVGSVLLLDTSGPTLGSTVTINEVLGYVGLASSAVLVLRLIAEIVRDGLT